MILLAIGFILGLAFAGFLFWVNVTFADAMDVIGADKGRVE